MGEPIDLVTNDINQGKKSVPDMGLEHTTRGTQNVSDTASGREPSLTFYLHSSGLLEPNFDLVSTTLHFNPSKIPLGIN